MLTWMKRLVAGGAMALVIGATGVMVTSPAHADEVKKPAVTEPATTPAATPAAAEPAPVLCSERCNKADTAWLLVCTALVILMTLPGLALFYGGLTRSKNILSILVQCMFIFSLIAVLWSICGYSFAFSEGGAFIGGLGSVILAGH